MLYLFGTSNALIRDGYATRLAEHAPLVNRSIGDQTSITGLMRLHGVLGELAPDDLVVWEYALLDALLTDAGVDPDAVAAAAEDAWSQVRARGARLVIAQVTPRRAAAAGEGFPILDRLRAAAERFGTFVASDPAAGYDDDRHLSRTDGSSRAFAERIIAAADGAQPAYAARDARLRWIPAAAFGATREHANSLVQADAYELGEPVAIPRGRAIAGVVSTAESGPLWCGHFGCPAASTRLPEAVRQHKFLVRATRVPCLRLEGPLALRAAPSWGLSSGVYADYGMERSDELGPVHLIGLLIAPRCSGTEAARSAPGETRS